MLYVTVLIRHLVNLLFTFTSNGHKFRVKRVKMIYGSNKFECIVMMTKEG